MDCGPTCLRMVAKYYGRHFNADTLRERARFTQEGVSMMGINEAAESLGFRTRGVKIDLSQLTDLDDYPAILHWKGNHFVVFLPGKEMKRKKKRFFWVADPALGIKKYTEQEFIPLWTNEDSGMGTALLLEPSPAFYAQEGEKEHKLDWGNILLYLKGSRWPIIQVFIALIITSLLQLTFPFLTQSIVDTGINTRNLQFITIVLLAQLMLVFSRAIVDFIRSRLLLRISNILNLAILSDFWIKITRLPISYFDSHPAGETLQRISDTKQIQNFLTGSVISTLFSLFNFIVFGIVLVIYNSQLFLIFCIGSGLYFLWIVLFLRMRRRMNYEAFELYAKENNTTLQLVQGMQEIRLNNTQQSKRWEWENIQIRIFRLLFKSLNYSQIQQAGAIFINQGKDLFLTFLVARLVIEGRLSLGAMLAIQYVLGQLSSPVEQIVALVQNGQDAKISMERLNAVHKMEDEEPAGKTFFSYLPSDKTITISDLSFTYPGQENDPVLHGINLSILQGKVTAIVGGSGSGKTTLLKLLLKFYDNYRGSIRIGESNFNSLSHTFWRDQCGAVLQDGYIFNDSIARNIAVGEEAVNSERLEACCRTANIFSFIESLHRGFYTKIGTGGIGISQGQKQRILIARALYKDPQYLFFDEATNALDVSNERAIIANLQNFFGGRTVVVIAHRLSTVRNADKIVVLHEGKITEEGTHESLYALKGRYYELVKNQLDLAG